MNLELSDDQLELRVIAGDFLTTRGDLSLARGLLEQRASAAPLIAETTALGWYAVGLEPDDPFGLPGLCLLAEQVGAHASPSLLVDSAFAARLAAGSAADQDEDAHQVAAGALSASVCGLEEGGDWGLQDIQTTAHADGTGGWRLHGQKIAARHAVNADRLLVLANEGMPATLLISPLAPGVVLEPAPGLDASACAHRVSFDDAPASLLTQDRGAIVSALAIAAVATAAEGLGAAARAMEMAVAYSLERRQFGRAIGSNQALQHLLADMHVARETAWSTILYAAGALDESLPEAPRCASIAKAYAARATREIVEGALQVFGGVGFTWEHEVHLLQRRALDCEHRFGDAAAHERILAAELTASVSPGQSR
jgi:alkylation response protein AidB-like acyl-CoA dehydrogenase